MTDPLLDRQVRRRLAIPSARRGGDRQRGDDLPELRHQPAGVPHLAAPIQRADRIDELQRLIWRLEWVLRALRRKLAE